MSHFHVHRNHLTHRSHNISIKPYSKSHSKTTEQTYKNLSPHLLRYFIALLDLNTSPTPSQPHLPSISQKSASLTRRSLELKVQYSTYFIYNKATTPPTTPSSSDLISSHPLTLACLSSPIPSLPFSPKTE